MKEDEAKTKECRVAGVSEKATNGGWNWPNCSGSGCGHWVEDKGFYGVNGASLTKEQSNNAITPESIGATWVKTGRCGLAGKS